MHSDITKGSPCRRKCVYCDYAIECATERCPECGLSDSGALLAASRAARRLKCWLSVASVACIMVVAQGVLVAMPSLYAGGSASGARVRAGVVSIIMGGVYIAVLLTMLAKVRVHPRTSIWGLVWPSAVVPVVGVLLLMPVMVLPCVFIVGGPAALVAAPAAVALAHGWLLRERFQSRLWADAPNDAR